jgi:hypothetical protein
LVTILAPIGFFISNKDQRKVFLPFLILFIVGNLFQFSPEIAANHKFFNLFLIGANMFMAHALVSALQRKTYARVAIFLIAPFLILSGVIDFFPIVNDSLITIQDIPNNKSATFIKNNTPGGSVFLNSSFLYNPASLAGRKIFVGWPYFAWSAGYDTNERGKLLHEFYSSSDRGYICTFLRNQNISYFTVEDTRGNRDFPEIDLNFFENNFKSVFMDGNFSIYETKTNCQ